MKRPASYVSGAVVGLVGLLGYHALSPLTSDLRRGCRTNRPARRRRPPTTTTTSAPPPPHDDDDAPRSTTPIDRRPPLRPPRSRRRRRRLECDASRSATGESVNYIYGVLSVKVTASGSTISKVSIGSINDGGNYRSESIDRHGHSPTRAAGARRPERQHPRRLGGQLHLGRVSSVPAVGAV